MDLSLGFSIPGPRSEVRETKFIASDSYLLPSDKITASLDQLNYWSDYFPDYYENLVDYSYNAVASSLGSGQMVSWSEAKGYHAVDIDDIPYSKY